MVKFFIFDRLRIYFANHLTMNKNNLLNYFSHQVNLYLDNRLTEDSKENLMDAINNDSECSKVYKTEKQFRDFIRSRAKRPCASKDLINSIKSKLD